MTETKLLIGSLSSDLYRVANLVGRNSYSSANRFFQEAQKWSLQLSHTKVKKHIKKIISDINSDTQGVNSVEKAEKLLMYGILLQNYSLHLS
jgi:hypothetical protein